MPPPVRACLFDMDGLLLNTEDLFTTCINIILSRHDKPNLPWSVKARMQGRTAEQSNAILLQWAQLPLTMPDLVAELRALHEQIFPNADLLPGVENLLSQLRRARDSGRVELALATSSARVKFELKTRRWTQLFDDTFPADLKVMGDDPRVVEHKPAPDIYICAVDCVNAGLTRAKSAAPIQADGCLVLEDSVQGVEAGRRAGMQVVWCPHPGLLKELLHGETPDARQDLCRVLGLSDSVFLRDLNEQVLAEEVKKATDG